MKTKILTLGLICFFIFAYCTSPADLEIKNILNPGNPGNPNNPGVLLQAILEINTIPEVPAFYYYKDWDKSESTFTIVITETNEVGGFFHSRLSFDTVSCGWSFSKEVFEPLDTVSILAKACARQRPITMTFWLKGYDDNGYEIDMQVNIPFTFEN